MLVWDGLAGNIRASARGGSTSAARSGADTAAQLFRDAVLQDARLFNGDAGEIDRSGRSNGDQNPGSERGEEADDGGSLQREHHLRVFEVHVDGSGTQRLHAMDNGERQQEDRDGQRAYADERDIDGAVEALPRAAVGTGRQ